MRSVNTPHKGWAACAAFLFFLTVAALASSTFFSVKLAEAAAGYFLSPAEISYSRAHGNLLTGLTLDELAIKGLPKAPAVDLTAHQATFHFPNLEFKDLAIQKIDLLPTGAVVDIQKMVMKIPFSLLDITRVENGRIKFSLSDTLLFYGKQDNGDLEFNFYSKSIRLREILSVSPLKRWAGLLAGNIGELQLAVAGTLKKILLRSTFTVEEFRMKGFSLSHAPVEVNELRIEPGRKPQVFGEIKMASGELVRQNTHLKLSPSRVSFDGDPQAAAIDAAGTSRIGDTEISVYLRGTSDRPEFRVSSSPSLPQEKLLLMLATGREWKGLDRTLANQKFSADFAAEFLDYFVFGGTGAGFAERMGIREISLEVEGSSVGAGVKKKMTQSVDVGYGIAENTDEQNSSQTIGFDFRVSQDSMLSLEGKRTTYFDDGQSLEAPADDDQVTLKLKRQF